MMMIFQNLLWISSIVCFIVDISGFIPSLKMGIWALLSNKQYRDFSLKPIDCSLCMIFWAGLFYLYIINELNLYTILLVCLLSFLSSSITAVLRLFKDCIDILVDIIYKNLDKTAK